MEGAKSTHVIIEQFGVEAGTETEEGMRLRANDNNTEIYKVKKMEQRQQEIVSAR